MKSDCLTTPLASAAARTHMSALLAQGVAQALQWLSSNSTVVFDNIDELVTPLQLQDAYDWLDRGAYAACSAHFQAAYDQLGRLLPKERHACRTWLDQHSNICQEQILAHLRQLFSQAGWPASLHAELAWEQENPLLCLRHSQLASLRLLQADQFSGERGSVSLYINQHGRRFAAKHAKDTLGSDILSHEFEGYYHVINRVGPHRNLMTPLGLCRLAIHGRPRRQLLLLAVDGAPADAVFTALRNYRRHGLFSPAQIDSAFLFILRRLLSVIEHFHQAGIVCGDIKPANIRFDLQGEPILGDLDSWTFAGGIAPGCSPRYAAPEAIERLPVDHRSDLFNLGATMVSAIEGEHLYMHTASGPLILWPSGARPYGVSPGDALPPGARRHPADSDSSPYQRAMASLLHPDPQQRPSLTSLYVPDAQTEADQNLLALLSFPQNDDAAKALIRQAQRPLMTLQAAAD